MQVAKTMEELLFGGVKTWHRMQKRDTVLGEAGIEVIVVLIVPKAKQLNGRIQESSMPPKRAKWNGKMIGSPGNHTE